MNIKKIIIILFSVIFLEINIIKANSQLVFADKKTVKNSSDKVINNVGYSELRNFGAILDNEILKGYFMFKRLDSKGSTSTFQLELFDENLRSKKQIKFERKRSSNFIEMCFNGKAFLIVLTNGKGIDLYSYDIEGKKLGEKNISKLNKFERRRILSSIQTHSSMNILNSSNYNEIGNSSIYPMGESGFYKISFAKNKKLGYTIEGFTNNLKPLWSYGSEEQSKQVEIAEVLYSSEKYLAVVHSRKKKLISKEIDNDFVLFEGKKGKKLFTVPMKKLSTLSIQGCNIIEDKNEIILNGEYYAKGKKVYHSKSEGLYLMKLNMKGEEIKMVNLAWDDELKNVTSIDAEKNKNNDKIRFFIHDVFIDSTGRTYLIAEQYKKVVSGAGVALNLAANASGGSSNISNVAIKIYNIVYIIFDNKFDLEKAELVKKKHSEFFLLKGQEFASPTALAQIIKSSGNFDYLFSNIDRKTNSLTAYYKDLNKNTSKEKDAKKNDVVIGSISINSKGVELKRTPFNSEYRTFVFRKAGIGKILFGEFSYKKNQLMVNFQEI